MSPPRKKKSSFATVMIKIQIVCKSYHTWPHVFLFSNLILQSNMVTEMDLDVRGDTTESFLKILLRMFLGSCCILKKIIKKKSHWALKSFLSKISKANSTRDHHTVFPLQLVSHFCSHSLMHHYSLQYFVY